MSAWLGQRYHHFDEISLGNIIIIFDAISTGLGNIIIFLMQSPRAWAT
jgi:hypothetical protein